MASLMCRTEGKRKFDFGFLFFMVTLNKDGGLWRAVSGDSRQ